MLTFAMNAANFGSYLGGGAAAGAQLTPSGLQLGWQEFALDSQTLALWHLHRQSWADATGAVPLTSHGAVLTPNGAECARVNSQYAAGNFSVQGQGAITVEGWAQFNSLPATGWSYPLLGQHNNLRLYLTNSGGGNYSLVLWSIQSGNVSRKCSWLFAAPPIVGRWYHIAGIWQRNGNMQIYVDGVAGDSPLVTANADFMYSSVELWVGRMETVNNFDGGLDELRVSSTIRYTDNFTPGRYAPAGTFTSPVLDAQRTGARWLGLDVVSTLPETTELTLAVRAGDVLDGTGQVAGVWQPAGVQLPSGRYFQWQATLLRSTDPTGLATATLESVTATSSESGYNIYHGLGRGATEIDYDTPAGGTGPGVLAFTQAGLAAPGVHWFGVRSSNDAGVVSETTDAEVQLELDAAGNVVLPRPASVQGLSAAAVAGGGVTLAWFALPETGAVAPAAFRIYSDGGTGTVNFAAALGSVAYVAGQRSYQWTSGALAAGAMVQLAVRAETSAGGVDAAPATVTVTPKATRPRVVGQVSGATVLAERIKN